MYNNISDLCVYKIERLYRATYMFALDLGIILIEVHYFVVMEARNQFLCSCSIVLLSDPPLP